MEQKIDGALMKVVIENSMARRCNSPADGVTGVPASLTLQRPRQ